MGMARNLGKAERGVRAAIGVILVAAGFALSGAWQPISIVVGIGLIFTALMGF